VQLFAPAEATRIRRNVGADTPFPEYIAHAQNPPAGAIVYYTLPTKPAHPVTLEVLDASGNVVRHLSSVAPPPVPEASHPPEPNFWIAPPYAIPADAGLNRAVWDLRYDPPPAFTHTFEINANPGETPPSPEGPLALPGTYTLRLTVDGKTYTQTLTVRNDPRETTPQSALVAQNALNLRLVAGIDAARSGHDVAIALRDAVQNAQRVAGAGSSSSDIDSAATELAARLDSLAGDPNARGGRGRGASSSPSFVQASAALVTELEAQDVGDVAPTPSSLAAAHAACERLGAAQTALRAIETQDIPAFNALLAKHSAHPLTLPKAEGAASGC
jgi:hypothetical protein